MKVTRSRNLSKSFPGLALAFMVLLAAASCGSENGPDSGPNQFNSKNNQNSGKTKEDEKSMTNAELETATFGAGCYWCVEAVLQQVEGVKSVASGFMGGAIANPSYEAVCSGTTGHAEVVQLTFDPSVVSYETILSWFWQLHDPTTLNRQGADVGTQYRSVIFYHSEAQHETALKSKEAAAGDFDAPIVTEISQASTFYEAKADHQDFYQRNKRNGYCRAVIAPKLKKLKLKE